MSEYRARENANFLCRQFIGKKAFKKRKSFAKLTQTRAIHMRSPPASSDLSGRGSCCHPRLLCPPFSRDTFTQVSKANLTHVVAAISLYITRGLPFNPSLGEAVYTNEVT